MAKLRMLRTGLRAMDPRSVRPAPKTAEPFYSSPEWIEMRDRVRREAGGRCQRPGCEHRGYIVDHIIEIRDGGARLDRSNLILLCSPHHGTKTAEARARRAAARAG